VLPLNVLIAELPDVLDKGFAFFGSKDDVAELAVTDGFH
jgi:hypothetical protein